MKKKEMICIVCPIGCSLQVVEDPTNESGYIVRGHQCDKGRVYGIKEMTNPTRLITSTVKIKGGDLPRLPVRTDREIPKNLIFDSMKIINEIEVEAPISMGDILVENILESGSNIVASRSFKKKK